MNGKTKRAAAALLAVMSAAALFACRGGIENEPPAELFGTYQYSRLIGHCEDNTTSWAEMEAIMKDTSFTISRDSFVITVSSGATTIENPVYDKNEITSAELENFVGYISSDCATKTRLDIGSYSERVVYTVYNEDNKSVGYKIFSLDDTVWIASYIHKGRSEEIQEIFAVSKM